MNAKKLGFERNIIHKLVCKHGIAPQKIAVTCNPLLHQGRVCHRAASKLANTNLASELTCRHKTRGIRWMPLVLAGVLRLCRAFFHRPEVCVGRVNLRRRRIPGGMIWAPLFTCQLKPPVHRAEVYFSLLDNY